MKIHRFIGVWDLSKNEVEITNFENIKQIRNVLRLEIGEQMKNETKLKNRMIDKCIN